MKNIRICCVFLSFLFMFWRTHNNIKKVRHKLCMLNGHAEAQSFYVIQISGVTVKAAQNMIGTLFGNSPVEGIYVAQFRFVITAAHPMKLAQINSIRYTEILERAKKLAVYGLWQTDFRRDAIVEVRQDTLTVHTFWRCGQAQ